MKTILHISLFIALLLGSCSGEEPDRRKLIEEQLSLELPSSYETLKNEYVTLEVIPSEHKIEIKLKFDRKGYKDIENQIINTPYYDQLRRYLNNGKGLSLQGSEIESYNEVKDSLSRINRNGGWLKTNEGYRYVDILGPKHQEPVQATINSKNRTLSFEYMKI